MLIITRLEDVLGNKKQRTCMSLIVRPSFVQVFMLRCPLPGALKRIFVVTGSGATALFSYPFYDDRDIPHGLVKDRTEESQVVALSCAT